MKLLTISNPQMEGSFNSEHKIFIREHWNKPLLKFLSKKINDKLLYLGLPSPKADDILEWIDYIKSVIAFQCREYGEIPDESQSRVYIEELSTLLNQLEREKQIENFVVFDGYLEEVVLRGYDNSPKRINFELSDFTTLYNLDFCNKITSPIEYLDQMGVPKKAYKFNALNRLLQIQQSLGTLSKKFVLFLTVHCSYEGFELQNFISHPPNEEIKEYFVRYYKLKGSEKNSRIVRLFFAYHIQQQFITYGFTPNILPSLVYNGLGDTPLLHFTVFGIAAPNTAAGVSSFQSLSSVLKQKFISINDSKFVNRPYDFEGEKEVELNPVQLFTNSETFNKMWV